MGYKLCMAEKPSVARDIANVIGATNPGNGYFEGNGYRVTWAVGHLVGLAEPEEYGYTKQKDLWENKEKSFAELPIIPEYFKLIVLESTKPQFEIVKKLINDPNCDEIINCGDMGPEGHILQWFIREKAGCRKPVRRFCATSMTPEAIKKAMANLRPEEEFANIIKGEYCKKKADWIMGMSMSRAESLKYNSSITVGRVQSPTLAFVVKRHYEIENFKVTDYYGLKAQLNENFSVFWNKDFQKMLPDTVKDSEGRLLDSNFAENLKNQIEQGKTGQIIEVKKENKKTDRPQLFDITELQRVANRKYGYSASETLACAQALYETHKVLTYPRTDSRYITSDIVPYLEERLKGIASIPKYTKVVDSLLKTGLNVDKKIVDDSKVTDHHAIIPTELIVGFNPDNLFVVQKQSEAGITKEMLKNVLDLVLTRTIESLSPAYLYEQTQVAVAFTNKMIFTAKGQKPLQMGWKSIQKELSSEPEEESSGNEDADQMFGDIQKGQIVNIKDVAVVAKKTSPPKYHTDDTLLTAMENAGSTIENGAILKGKGIGTQATRGEIIKKLFTMGYVRYEKKGKTNYIIPNEKGLKVIKVLPPELYSPKITADWETKIALIAEGKMSEKAFMDDFTVFINEKVKQVKESTQEVEFKTGKESIGRCPWCKHDIYKYVEKYPNGKEKGITYYCSNKAGNCNFNIKSNDPFIASFTGKKLSETRMKTLLEKGTITLECISKKGTKYKRYFTITKNEVNGKIWPKFETGFREDKTRKVDRGGYK